MQTSGSALSAQSVINVIVKSLPTTSDEDKPLIKDAYAAIGLLAHACMIAVGFRLKGLGEDHKIGMVILMVQGNVLTKLKNHPPTRTILHLYLQNGTLPLQRPFDMLIPSRLWNSF